MRYFSFIFCIIVTLLSLTATQARIIHVPAEQSTIQLGLNAAEPWDTVIASPGTYSEFIFWPATNSIRLLSESGADNTTINANNLSSVVYFPGLGVIDNTTVLRGFRITNGGNVPLGGGIYLTQSSPIIEQCKVEGNNAGAGIYCNNSSNPIIRSCTISQNSGGGIYVIRSAPWIEACTVQNNIPDIPGNGFGAGIYCGDSSNPTIKSCIISQNEHAGIEFHDYSNGMVDSCFVFDNNRGGWGWGGILADKDTNLNITNTHIEMNQGSGIALLYNCRANIAYCEITENSGQGIVALSGPQFYVSNSSISRNSDKGVYIGTSGDVCLIKCIVKANGSNGIDLEGNSTLALENSQITNNGGFGVGVSSNVDTIENCLVSSNLGGGIRCASQSSPVISNTVVADNDSSGIVFDGDIYQNPTITGCTIVRNSTTNGGGIFCSYPNSPIIKHCTISENRALDKGDGIYTTSASWLSLDSNNICYNGYGIYNYDNSQLLIAANNWWGHASGPHHPNYNPNGKGDSVNYFVYPLPYLTEADTIAPPIPPVGLEIVKVGGDSIVLSWHASPIGDLAEYKVYFDSDSSGFPYSDTADAGLDTSITLYGLSTGTTYYLAVTCYDHSGNESWYSREIQTVRRGDSNGDGVIDLGDVVYLITYLYKNGSAPNPLLAGDVNCSGEVELGDVVYLISYLYKGGPPPSC